MNCPINGKPCSKYKAFHLTENVNEKVENYMVCEDCLYTHISKNSNQVAEEVCSCGTKLSDVLKGGRMGCSKCYDFFGSNIGYVLATIQNLKDPKHIGRTPYLWKKQQAENTSCSEFAEEMRRKIDRCIERQSYKEAAWIKTQIQKFQEIEKRYINSDKEQASSIKTELVDFILQFRDQDLSL